MRHLGGSSTNNWVIEAAVKKSIFPQKERVLAVRVEIETAWSPTDLKRSLRVRAKRKR